MNRVSSRRTHRLLAVILSVAGVGLAPASVSAACSQGRPNDGFGGFSGTQRTTTAIATGVQTRIEVYNPYTYGTSGVYAWNMLTRPKDAQTGFEYWAQIGWLNRKTSSSEYLLVFTSWTDNNGNYWLKEFDTVTAGSYHVFYTYYAPGSGGFRFYRGTKDYGLEFGGWTPKGVQIYGEIHTRASQMPGAVNNKLLMDGAKYILIGESTWRNMASAAGANDAANFGATKNSDTSYSIWDKDCAN